jgi:hypothetical protein
MKFFAFIMAILVLALSIMPCADGAIAMNQTEIKTEISKTTHQHDVPNHDICSPFCHCACCSAVTVIPFISIINTELAISDKTKAAFLPSQVIDITLPVWQPPQLV